MPPKKRRGDAATRAARPGLALTAESPVRPLAAFTGFQPRQMDSKPGGPQPATTRRAKPVANGGLALGGNGNSIAHPSVATNTVTATATTPRTASPQTGLRSTPARRAPLKGKERHLITAAGAAPARTAHSMLWVDRNESISKSDLAIHKKKVEQVEGWLRDALEGKPTIQKYRRILVLHGPAGAGKSTLIRSLSRRDELDFAITDWSEDALHASSSGSGRDHSGGFDEKFAADFTDRGIGPSSGAAARFGSFLSAARSFPALSLEDHDPVDADSAGISESSTQLPEGHSNSSRSRRILLLDDLPNLFHAPTRAAFFDALRAFALERAPSLEGNIPLVVCITETTPRLDDWGGNHAIGGWRERSDETLGVRTAIPDDVRNHAAVATIPFNSVAPTILRRTLRSLLGVARKTDLPTATSPTSAHGKELVEAVIETCNGDIRSAINTLQFALARENPPIVAEQGTKRDVRGKVKNAKRPESLRGILSAATGREASLALFHALGKILYNKRQGDAADDDESPATSDDNEDIEQRAQPSRSTFTGLAQATDDSDAYAVKGPLDLPRHLAHLERRKSRMDVESLWRTMPLDASTLQAYLHQNYPPFCDTIEQCADLMEGLSDAEALKPAHEEWFHGGLTQYYSFLISTHTALLALPSPVKRRKEQRFRGVGLFEAQRRLRSAQETLQEVGSALTHTGRGEAARASSSSVLMDCQADKLACEVLPYMMKCRPPGGVPDAVRELCSLPWTSFSSPSGLLDGGDVGDEDNEDERLLGSTAATGAPGAGIFDTQLYDDEGRKVDVQVARSDELASMRARSARQSSEHSAPSAGDTRVIGNFDVLGSAPQNHGVASDANQQVDDDDEGDDDLDDEIDDRDSD